MTGDLVTWEKVKAVLNLADDQKELIEFLISAASAQAEKIAGRFLAARDVELKMDSTGGREFLLPSYPVNSTEKVLIADRETQGYKVKHESGILRITENIPTGWDVIYFKGNIGYAPVPEDLQQAVIEIISANIRRFTTPGGTVGVKTFTATASSGTLTTQYELDIPISSRSVFMSYRGARV